MPRSRWQDFLSSHLFWAMDVSGSKNIPIFTPLFGFSGISAPKISVELETFKDGTYIYPRNVVKGASVGSVTFSRAASLYDSDFYDWITYAIYGTRAEADTGFAGDVASFLGNTAGPIRRDILLFQFARINADPRSEPTSLAGLAEGIATSAVLAAVASTVVTLGGATSLAAGAVGSALGIGPFSAHAWLPARAWLLHSCLPVNYTAASDFNASSGDVSIMQLEIMPEYIEEFSCGI